MVNRIAFNLNGQIFELGKDIFIKFLETKNLELPEAETNQSKSTEYFFQRHSESFAAILDYLQHGTLHLPSNVCPDIFKRELQFWGIEAKVMAPCCYRKYLLFFEDEKTLEKFRKTVPQEGGHNSAKESLRSRIWRVLDDPSSSVAAKVYLGISIMFVLLSLFVLVASTHIEFQRNLDKYEWRKVLGADKYEKFKNDLPHHGLAGGRFRRSSSRCHCGDWGSENQTDTAEANQTTYLRTRLSPESMFARNRSLTYIEYITTVYFTLELIIRFCFAPSKGRFFFSFLNAMDTLALLAMYTTILVLELIPSWRYMASVADSIEGLQIVRVFRVFRIVNHVVGLRVLVYSVQSGIREILLLLLYLSIGTVLFASVIYFLERDNMMSIPDAAWWVVVTMTTVGYGDTVPISAQGKLVGCLCAICGVFLIAVTVPIFVSNFMLFYSYSRVVLKMNKDMDTSDSNRKSNRREFVARTGSLTKNKIGTEGAVEVEDYT